jgi:quinoprotein glucose dehydrogenase
VGDVIVEGTGGAAGDMATHKKGDPSVVRGFDARTGKILWEFSPMAAPDDPARSSWGAGSAEIAGYMATWGELSADEKLGYVYIPFGGPGPPGFGGWRSGDNLYSASLVALDAKTGKKIWHFQAVHHDLWDWDLSAPPVLGTITVDGRRIDAVMQTGKVPLLYTLDRHTGKPVWPIVERSVPTSDVPGEISSPTQPIPTKPPPLDRLGVTESELLDFTPELHAEALAEMKKHRYGPMFVPPSVYAEGGNLGSLTIPASDGSAGWNTGAFDPVHGVYYAMTITAVASYALVKADPPADVVYSIRDNDATWYVRGPRGLPLVKPPYGRISAVDMNRGEILWVVANGDGPRNNPAIKHLNLPPLGLPGRVAVAVTPELVFAPEGSDAVLLTDVYGGGGDKFRAFDKADGKVLKEVTLPAGATGAPITYVVDGRQYIVVAVGDSKHEAQWVALGL